MNDAHLHLLSNHLPIIGCYFSTILLAIGIISGNKSLKNGGLIFIALCGIVAIPAFVSGEGAEDILRSMAKDNRHFIHHHEEHAEKAFWFIEALAVFSLIALYASIRKNRNWPVVVTLIGALFSCYLMAVTANSGGEIRHTEIRETNGVKEE